MRVSSKPSCRPAATVAVGNGALTLAPPDLLFTWSRRARLPRDLVHSVCPHDCPSTCALEVERLDERSIGRVHGRKGHPYTAGVVCAKVARYAERQHHPERLRTPLR